MSMIQLPIELIVEIFNHVEYYDLVNLTETCKHFYDIITFFSWKPLCLINKLKMPSNIQFTNYILNLQNTSDTIFEEFCVNVLLKINPFNTVVISNACVSKLFFNFLQCTTCKNVVLLGGCYIYNRQDEYSGNFNFYKVRGIYTEIHNSSGTIILKKYDLKTHVKIFGNSIGYDLIHKIDTHMQHTSTLSRSITHLHYLNTGKTCESISTIDRYINISNSSISSRKVEPIEYSHIEPVETPASAPVARLKVAEIKLNAYFHDAKNKTMNRSNRVISKNRKKRL